MLSGTWLKAAKDVRRAHLCHLTQHQERKNKIANLVLKVKMKHAPISGSIRYTFIVNITNVKSLHTISCVIKT